jgi:AraC-like DNA-binding protein
LLHPVLETHAAALVRTLPAIDTTSDRVRRVLAAELCDGEPSLDRIAGRLHTSPRTLHRRLTVQGTTFRRLVADVRRELAERCLTEGKLAIGESAFLLGYSEASVFHRAFKRWTGQQPVAFRQRQLPRRAHDEFERSKSAELDQRARLRRE